VRYWLTEQYEDTSTPDSGRYVTRAPVNKAEWGIDFTGVTVLKDDVDTLWFGWEFMLEIVRSQGVNVQVIFTDKNGFTKNLTGHVFLPSTSIEGTAGDVAKDTISFLGNGAVNFDSLITPNVPPRMRLEWIASDGQTDFQNNSLIGKTIANIEHVSREGDDKYQPVTIAPTERQVQLDAVNGKLIFKIAADAGEYIFALVS
jgi:hypothetical protein